MIRPETPKDVAAIRRVNAAAFLHHPISRQTEHLIVDALRSAGALDISLVADTDGEIVGHIAFSAASIGDMSAGWFLLGPVAVLPDRQGQGIGRALVEAGLDELRARKVSGCALVGEPAFYERFGFAHRDGQTCHGVPDEYVLCLPLSADVPRGEVIHHPAFSVTA